MRGRSGADRRRSGKIVVLFALLLPFLVGGMGLSVDTGVLGTARSQMQAGADGGALAGARQLALYRNPGSMGTMISQARASAGAIARANRVLGDEPVIADNPNNVATGEIVVGYLDPASTRTALLDTTVPALQFNSVQVRLVRDGAHGGVVPGFFSSALGHHGARMTVVSTATMRNFQVSGFRSVNNQAVNLLPIVLDKATYDAMLSGTTTDAYSWDDSTRGVVEGSDGYTESRLYPVKNGDPGNWGTVKIGVSNNSTSTLGSQIRDGVTPAQMATYPNGTIQLNASLTPPSITFEGNPGISAGIKDDLAAVIGRPSFVPIYDQTGGNGNNAWYRVVKFAGVRILDVNFQGNPKYVIVQPALVNEASAVAGAGEASLAAGGLVRLYLSR